MMSTKSYNIDMYLSYHSTRDELRSGTFCPARPAMLENAKSLIGEESAIKMNTKSSSGNGLIKKCFNGGTDKEEKDLRSNPTRSKEADYWKDRVFEKNVDKLKERLEEIERLKSNGWVKESEDERLARCLEKAEVETEKMRRKNFVFQDRIVELTVESRDQKVALKKTKAENEYLKEEVACLQQLLSSQEKALVENKESKIKLDERNAQNATMEGELEHLYQLAESKERALKQNLSQQDKILKALTKAKNSAQNIGTENEHLQKQLKLTEAEKGKIEQELVKTKTELASFKTSLGTSLQQAGKMAFQNQQLQEKIDVLSEALEEQKAQSTKVGLEITARTNRYHLEEASLKKQLLEQGEIVNQLTNEIIYLEEKTNEIQRSKVSESVFLKREHDRERGKMDASLQQTLEIARECKQMIRHYGIMIGQSDEDIKILQEILQQRDVELKHQQGIVESQMEMLLDHIAEVNVDQVLMSVKLQEEELDSECENEVASVMEKDVGDILSCIENFAQNKTEKVLADAQLQIIELKNKPARLVEVAPLVDGTLQTVTEQVESSVELVTTTPESAKPTFKPVTLNIGPVKSIVKPVTSAIETEYSATKPIIEQEASFIKPTTGSDMTVETLPIEPVTLASEPIMPIVKQETSFMDKKTSPTEAITTVVKSVTLINEPKVLNKKPESLKKFVDLKTEAPMVEQLTNCSQQERPHTKTETLLTTPSTMVTNDILPTMEQLRSTIIEQEKHSNNPATPVIQSATPIIQSRMILVRPLHREQEESEVLESTQTAPNNIEAYPVNDASGMVQETQVDIISSPISDMTKEENKVNPLKADFRPKSSSKQDVIMRRDHHALGEKKFKNQMKNIEDAQQKIASLYAKENTDQQGSSSKMNAQGGSFFDVWEQSTFSQDAYLYAEFEDEEEESDSDITFSDDDGEWILDNDNSDENGKFAQAIAKH